MAADQQLTITESRSGAEHPGSSPPGRVQNDPGYLRRTVQRSDVTVRVLGNVTASTTDHPIEISGDKPRLLLALLASRSGSTASVESLIDGLWGDDPPETARKSLQVHVSNLRRAIGDRTVVTEPNGYRLNAVTDVEMFERGIGTGLKLLEEDPPSALTSIEESLNSWRGIPYAEFLHVPALATDSTRLNELMLQGREARMEAMLRLARHSEVLASIDALIAEHPYREGLRGLKMIALYRAGRQAEALGVYQETRNLLVDELGIDPSRDLQDLEQRLLQQDPSLDAPEITSVHPVNLPARRSDLIGRDRDLSTVRGAIFAHRLVTLTGVGGCGKTRLALETRSQADRRVRGRGHLCRPHPRRTRSRRSHRDHHFHWPHHASGWRRVASSDPFPGRTTHIARSRQLRTRPRRSL